MGWSRLPSAQCAMETAQTGTSLVRTVFTQLSNPQVCAGLAVESGHRLTLSVFFEDISGKKDLVMITLRGHSDFEEDPEGAGFRSESVRKSRDEAQEQIMCLTTMSYALDSAFDGRRQKEHMKEHMTDSTSPAVNHEGSALAWCCAAVPGGALRPVLGLSEA
ncbi:hypothetical protein H920_13432 [Fukomys damarensis]|uniref:Uncharacterized protein n=1 Tax=Fukomys damarensis TaxID=885580 RepID=A0A091DR27_FUKDA|nr:hypothetical protein H920_13432 [Fukomys damarensis]